MEIRGWNVAFLFMLDARCESYANTAWIQEAYGHETHLDTQHTWIQGTGAERGAQFEKCIFFTTSVWAGLISYQWGRQGLINMQLHGAGLVIDDGAQRIFLFGYYTFDVSIAFSFYEQTTHTT